MFSTDVWVDEQGYWCWYIVRTERLLVVTAHGPYHSADELMRAVMGCMHA